MPVEYVDEIPAAVPTGRVVVHNTVVAHTPLGFNGLRAWLEAAEAESGHLERCDCTWAPELAVHYRVAPRKSRMPHGLVMQRRIALADLLAAGRRRYEDRYRRGEVTRARLIAHLVELDEWHFAEESFRYTGPARNVRQAAKSARRWRAWQAIRLAELEALGVRPSEIGIDAGEAAGDSKRQGVAS